MRLIVVEQTAQAMGAYDPGAAAAALTHLATMRDKTDDELIEAADGRAWIVSDEQSRDILASSPDTLRSIEIDERTAREIQSRPTRTDEQIIDDYEAGLE